MLFKSLLQNFTIATAGRSYRQGKAPTVFSILEGMEI